MIFTEEEAKTKWCPNRLLSETRLVGKEDGPIIFDRNCVASKCMSWRVYSVTKEPTGYTNVETHAPDNYGNVFSVVPEMKEIIRGYCGLAGIPHGTIEEMTRKSVNKRS